MRRLTPGLVVKNLLFTVIVPGTVAVYAPLALLGPAEVSLGGIARSAVFFLAGAAIYGWCLWDFASFGRGTPAPIDAPKRLVARGLYRYSRNPMYVGVLTAITGWLVIAPTPRLAIYLVAVWAVFELFVVFYEEPRLLELFGAEYRAYRSEVGRWLSLPRRG